MTPKVLNLRQMLNIALPAPNMEMINFNVLHNFLQTLLEAMELEEMEGSVSSSSLTKSNESEADANDLQKAQERDISLCPSVTSNELLKKKNNELPAKNSLATKLNKLNHKLDSLDDYVSRCMKMLSSVLGIDNFPKIHQPENKVAANGIISDVIDTVTSKESDFVQSINDRLLTVVADIKLISDKIEEFSKQTKTMFRDISDLTIKTNEIKNTSKQNLEHCSRLSVNIEKLEQSKKNGKNSIETKLKNVMEIIEKEKQQWQCSMTSVNDIVNDKASRLELNNVKSYVNVKLNDIENIKINSKINLENDNSSIKQLAKKTEYTNRNLHKTDASIKNTKQMREKDQIDKQWIECEKVLQNFQSGEMKNCVCSYIKGANGYVYKSDCKCCNI